MIDFTTVDDLRNDIYNKLSAPFSKYFKEKNFELIKENIDKVVAKEGSNIVNIILPIFFERSIISRPYINEVAPIYVTTLENFFRDKNRNVFLKSFTIFMNEMNNESELKQVTLLAILSAACNYIVYNWITNVDNYYNNSNKISNMYATSLIPMLYRYVREYYDYMCKMNQFYPYANFIIYNEDIKSYILDYEKLTLLPFAKWQNEHVENVDGEKSIHKVLF